MVFKGIERNKDAAEHLKEGGEEAVREAGDQLCDLQGEGDWPVEPADHQGCHFGLSYSSLCCCELLLLIYMCLSR